MRVPPSGRSENSGEPTDTPNTSPGSKAKSDASAHPVRNFTGLMSMGLSIFFAWLALMLAPWLNKSKPTDHHPKGD